MKLVVFDVDGTLVDSQHLICASMGRGFDLVGLETPDRPRILSCVGLSLDRAVAELAPDADDAVQRRIAAGYRSAFSFGRIVEQPPLYPGARDCLDLLSARDDLLLAVATGKSRRGVNSMIEAHGLAGFFVNLETADDHPSKPDPAMLRAAIFETGGDASSSVMIGDTGYDMQMAGAAGVAGFGVAWGYHDAAMLREAGAALVAPDFQTLTREIERWAG